MHIASLQQPTDQQQHKEVSQVKAQVDYLDSNTCRGWSILRCSLSCLYHHPRAFIKALNFFLRTKYSRNASHQPFYQAVCLTRLARVYGIQHIHAHFASEPAAVAELVSQLADISYSISAHAKDIYLSPKAVLRRKIANAQFVVTCTEYNCRYLQAINHSSTPVVRVYHGFDSRRFTTVDSGSEPLTSDRLLILSVGRLREKKGFETLIQACSLLKLAGYQFRCEIVGYGPQRESLQTLIQSLHLQRTVRLRGQLVHNDLIALYRQTAIFALPCQIGEDGDRDGIPNVLMEAMAMKIPVVSSAISGIPELVEDQISGLLIEPNKPQELSQSLSRLLDDEPLRHRLGNAGCQRVNNEFAVEPNIEILKALFNQSLNGTVNPALTDLSSEKEKSYAR